ncbi:Hypothetical protein NTJ_10076 [Nesidiocoris tenuis]|uniref:Uncharacterized protein n=1 Tax=Nesidiocoris tenuis TaxID=355587 RepID=A0ABN7B0W5_9HEMI|nr:Hypothetical protein NTJ_10076 [Nesidiocoris tenuis]
MKGDSGALAPPDLCRSFLFSADWRPKLIQKTCCPSCSRFLSRFIIFLLSSSVPYTYIAHGISSTTALNMIDFTYAFIPHSTSSKVHIVCTSNLDVCGGNSAGCVKWSEWPFHPTFLALRLTPSASSVFCLLVSLILQVLKLY